MKLIILYGPPGVGKMTVARELTKITKIKSLPHNLILNMIEPIISEDVDDDVLWWLYKRIELDIIRAAKKKGQDIVITELYNGDYIFSNERFKELIKELKKLNINYKFVKLHCEKREHLKRVVTTERKGSRKISSINGLKEIMKRGNLDAEIPFVKNFVIDATNIPARKTAQKIKNEFKLK